jgi:hypothetical protein
MRLNALGAIADKFKYAELGKANQFLTKIPELSGLGIITTFRR